MRDSRRSRRRNASAPSPRLATRLTGEGEPILSCGPRRYQTRNREALLERFATVTGGPARAADAPPHPPSAKAVERLLRAKHARGERSASAAPSVDPA